MKYVCVLASLLLSACAVTNPPPSSLPAAASVSPSAVTPSAPAPSPTAPAPDTPIRRVDFRNFTIDWYPDWADVPATGKKIILKDGSMNLDFDYGKEPRKFILSRVSYADLTGDGDEEAILVMSTITSGSDRPFLIFVYTLSGERPKRLWFYETGDRSNYGYRAASASDGQLLIELYKPKIVESQGQQHNLSQSDTLIRNYYKWDGATFVKIRTEEAPVGPDDSNPWVVPSRNSSNGG